MHKVISFWAKALKNRNREPCNGLPAYKKSIIPRREIMRKNHSKIKTLKFQHFCNGAIPFVI